MLHPSTIIDAGFIAAAPIRDFMERYSSGILGTLRVIDKPWAAITYPACYWLAVIAFALLAFVMVFVLIQFKLSVMTSTVLLPWGVLTHVAFISEMSIAWIVASLIRVMLTVCLVGIGVPLFEMIGVNFTGGGDPTEYSSIAMALVSFIFAGLAWYLPKQAAHIGGRGMALVIGSEIATRPAFEGVRMTMAMMPLAGRATAQAISAGGQAISQMRSAVRARIGP
jgi:type IV secretion system protein TrbL